MNSRNKGATGERELAKVLRGYGYNCRRGQQYCGANGDADVVGLPGLHIECKRVERLNLDDAMAQAKADARDISIHTTLAGGDPCGPTKRLPKRISIHTTLAGGDKRLQR